MGIIGQLILWRAYVLHKLQQIQKLPHIVSYNIALSRLEKRTKKKDSNFIDRSTIVLEFGK